jgi:hypothetical protein
MPATVAYREEDEKPDGSQYEMVAWQVPVSEDFQNEVTEIYEQRTD